MGESMKEWLDTWYNRYAILMLFAVLGFVAYSGIGWRGLSASDWGTWTGAIFTGLALGGTIWLATTETRRRKRAEYLNAVVVAAGLAPRIERITNDLRVFIAHLQFTNLQTGTHDIPSRMAGSLRQMEPLSVSLEEIVALTALGDNCASRLANAIAQFQIARKKISNYVSETIHLNEPLPENVAKEWEDYVSEPFRLFEMVRRQCSAAASEYAPQPSDEEFWGD
jgi:hypothetical protein